MGYYTTYTLNIHPRTDSIPLSKKTQSEIETALDEAGYFECGSFADGSWWADAKWYDHSIDMTKFSLRFPEALFELSGNGEDHDDMWVEYFCDGRSEYCQGRVVYDEPDMSALLGIDTDESALKVDNCSINSD